MMAQNVDGLVMLEQQRTATYLSLNGLDGDMLFAVNDMDILQDLNPDLLRDHEVMMGNASADLWLRSRAWVAYFGLMFLGFRLADDPTRVDEAGVELGRRQLRRVAASDLEASRA